MISTQNYADSTSVTQEFPFGRYLAARVMCSDGRVRTVSRISETADTMFSVRCAVRVKGRAVSGYLTIESRAGFGTPDDADPAVAKFIAHQFSRNGGLLPVGAWHSDRPAVPTVAARISYAQDGHVMFDDWYGEAEADSAMVFTADDTCVVALERTPRGRWAISGSDYGHVLTPSAYRRRFPTVADAVDYLAARVGVTFRLVDSWDDVED